MFVRKVLSRLSMLFVVLTVVGCASTQPRLKTVEKVDLERFMGRWYVIACIPTFIETKAYNEVEEYSLLPDGSIDTVLTFNKGGFDGPAKRYNPRGFVVDRVNNSTWAMRFIWPFKAEYLITYLNDDYSQTVIGRNKRDFFWYMARTPEVSQEDYDRTMTELSVQGYNMKKVRKVPQEWNRQAEGVK